MLMILLMRHVHINKDTYFLTSEDNFKKKTLDSPDDKDKYIYTYMYV